MTTSEASWTNVTPEQAAETPAETPRSRAVEPEVHPLTPTVDHVFEQDPWMRWHQQQQQRSEAQLPEFPLPSPGSTIGPNFSMPAPSTSIASPCMFMPMPRPSAQAAPPSAVRQPDWNSGQA